MIMIFWCFMSFLVGGLVASYSIKVWANACIRNPHGKAAYWLDRLDRFSVKSHDAQEGTDAVGQRPPAQLPESSSPATVREQMEALQYIRFQAECWSNTGDTTSLRQAMRTFVKIIDKLFLPSGIVEQPKKETDLGKP